MLLKQPFVSYDMLMNWGCVCY